MRAQFAIAAQILRARPREILILTATCLAAMPVGVAVLGLLQLLVKG